MKLMSSWCELDMSLPIEHDPRCGTEAQFATEHVRFAQRTRRARCRFTRHARCRLKNHRENTGPKSAICILWASPKLSRNFTERRTQKSRNSRNSVEDNERHL